MAAYDLSNNPPPPPPPPSPPNGPYIHSLKTSAGYLVIIGYYSHLPSIPRWSGCDLGPGQCCAHCCMGTTPIPPNTGYHLTDAQARGLINTGTQHPDLPTNYPWLSEMAHVSTPTCQPLHNTNRPSSLLDENQSTATGLYTWLSVYTVRRQVDCQHPLHIRFTVVSFHVLLLMGCWV